VENEAVTADKGTLYGASLSPFVRKVRAALSLKSIDYELVGVMPGAMDPEFLAKSPLSKIPVWEEGEFVLPDSSAICAYLDRRVPAPPLYPAEAPAFGHALFWDEYGDTRLVEAGGPPFFQRVVHAKVFKKPVDEEIVRRHVEEVLPPVYDQLERLFVDVGLANAQAITIAELGVWSPFVNLEHAGIEVDADQWPGLSDFVQAMNAHPALAPLVEEERAVMASL
jgi:glutathione S-transferase